jgi:hypothetical protein
MAAPFFGTTLTDLGRNITDRGMVDVAQQQAQQAYLAQLAATRAQERNVGTQVQGNRDIAQMQNESRVAHERAIQQLNTERNELLKQESQARSALDKDRIQAQLAMNERQIAAQQQMFAAQAYLSALGGGQQTMAPGVAQELMKAQLAASEKAGEVATAQSRLQEALDAMVNQVRGRNWLGRMRDRAPLLTKTAGNDSVAIQREAAALMRNQDPSNNFKLEFQQDNKGDIIGVKPVPREGVIPNLPSTTRPPMSPDQMGEFFNSIMSIFGQDGGFSQFPGVGVTPGGPPPQVPQVPDVGGNLLAGIPDVVGQSRVAWDTASPITGAGSFNDPYANNLPAALARAMSPNAMGQSPAQGGALPYVNRGGWGATEWPANTPHPEPILVLSSPPLTPPPLPQTQVRGIGDIWANRRGW